MDSNKQKKINDAVQKFNTQCGKLLKIASKIAVSDDRHLEWLIRMFKIAKDIDPLSIITRGVDKLWDSKNYIISKNKLFFMEELDTTKYIKNDGNKQWLDGIVETVKLGLDKLSKKEEEYVWICLNEMLSSVIEYKLLTDDFL
jgi:hypothetical protein